MAKRRVLQRQSVWDSDALLQAFNTASIKPIHAIRLWSYLIRHPAAGWSDVPDLPKAAKALLDESFVKFTTRVLRCVTSSDGETTKVLLALQDGQKVESVIMHYDTRAVYEDAKQDVHEVQTGDGTTAVSVATEQIQKQDLLGQAQGQHNQNQREQERLEQGRHTHDWVELCVNTANHHPVGEDDFHSCDEEEQEAHGGDGNHRGEKLLEVSGCDDMPQGNGHGVEGGVVSNTSCRAGQCVCEAQDGGIFGDAIPTSDSNAVIQGQGTSSADGGADIKQGEISGAPDLGQGSEDVARANYSGVPSVTGISDVGSVAPGTKRARQGRRGGVDGDSSTICVEGARRSTLCVSSQVGCQMGCTFCATGTMGLKGHLTAGEIVEQLVHANAITRIRNIVFMGMGEPLHNYEPVRSAVRLMTDSRTFALSRKHVTLSTVGVIPRIKQLATDLPGISLALSLHAPTQELRSMIVPSARAYPLDKLMQVVRQYEIDSGQRVFMEYVMLAGVNDGVSEAHALGALLANHNATLNLIPWNPVIAAASEEGKAPAPMKFSAPDMRNVTAFQAILREQYGIPTTVRQEKGQDIAGACGQLVIQHQGDGQDSTGGQSGCGTAGQGQGGVASTGSVRDIEEVVRA